MWHAYFFFFWTFLGFFLASINGIPTTVNNIDIY